MTPEELIDAFDVLAEAPDGVKRLRELVLQLAVRGKLVPQDAEDEPASALLERIRAERQPLWQAAEAQKLAAAPGRAKPGRYKAASTCDPSALPDLPEGWTWATLDELTCFIVDYRGKTPPLSKVGIPVVSAANIRDGSIDLAPPRFVSRDVYARWSVRGEPRDGDILITTEAPVGKTALYQSTTRLLLTRRVLAARVNGCVPEYVRRAFGTWVSADHIEGHSRGATVPRILKPNLFAVPIPLPPLPEQHRIVARVDELMSLLDRLEAARNAREATRTALRDAALAALRDADTPEEVDHAWTRVADHMHDLFTTPADIAPLRQTILQLAVRGRLVPQDPDDEAASVLLERVDADRRYAVETKATRMVKDPGGYDEEDSLPAGWSWVPLQNLVRFIDYRGKTPTKTQAGVRLITAKNVRDGFIREEPREYVSPETYDTWMKRGFPRPGDVLFTTEAPMGKAAVVDIDGRFALAQRIINLQPYADFSGPYLMRMLLSPWFKRRLKDRATGMTATGIKAAKLRLIRVPVPPLPEQQRIVAIVEKLMATVRQMENVLSRATTSHDTFAAAAVHHLDA